MSRTIRSHRTTTTSRAARLAAVGLAGALALTACSGGDDADGATTDAATATGTGTAAAQDAGLDELEVREVLWTVPGLERARQLQGRVARDLR